MEKINSKSNMIPRPPVVVVMGHVDHGKSTLLDYIRKSNVVEGEVGGITQKISAYEVIHKDESGQDRKITFLDTPGHEAFSAMRERGARIADVAILVVSAEDGVKPQTIEAWKAIVEAKLPLVVAINKIDKPESNVEKTKTELAEQEIYLENYGGKIPCAEISAKTGLGVDNLLSLILILTEMEAWKADPSIEASGFVIEANLDPKCGMGATLIVKNGTLTSGMTVAAGDAVCATRIMENFLGKPVKETSFSSPVRIFGFDKPPKVGMEFKSFKKKRDAEEYAERWEADGEKSAKNTGKSSNAPEDKKIIPIVLKADTAGSLEAAEKEIEKIENDGALFKIISEGTGPISESDIKNLAAMEDTLIIGFNVKADKGAMEMAEHRSIPIYSFDIIYKMSEWLTEEMEKRRPRVETVLTTGRAKIIRAFSRTKERQILGGKVLEGTMVSGTTVKVIRREFEIGKGKIVNLEKNKTKVKEVEEGSEFGMMLESKIEVAQGDVIEIFNIVHK